MVLRVRRAGPGNKKKRPEEGKTNSGGDIKEHGEENNVPRGKKRG